MGAILSKSNLQSPRAGSRPDLYRLTLPRFLNPVCRLILLVTICRGPVAAYIISEDNIVAEVLDSLVAPEEVIDSVRPPATHTFILDYQDENLTYVRDLGELVRWLPGAHINHFGSFGNQESVRLYNLNPSQVAVLLDGCPVGYMNYLGVDTHILPVQNLKRVEVIPFAGLLQTGQPATAGVVNLVPRGFNHFLPFYLFGANFKDDLGDYTGHLHFAQRIYRNLNFYMSSLLKKNQGEQIDYNAVQFILRLDVFLKNNWTGSFFSYNNTSEKLIPPVYLNDGTAALKPIVSAQSNNPANKVSFKKLSFSGTPYQGNASAATVYWTSATDDYRATNTDLNWLDWGLTARQEFKNLISGHRLETELRFKSATYQSDYTDTIKYTQLIEKEENTSSTYEITLRAKDQTTILDLVDLEAALHVSKFQSDDNIQFLPAAGLYYRKMKDFTYYLTLERTFRQPTPVEYSRNQYFQTSYFACRQDSHWSAPASESGSNLAVGLQYYPDRRLYINAGFFNRLITDAIYWQYPDSGAGDSTIYLANRSGSEVVNGLYLNTQLSLFKNRLNSFLSYSHLFDNGSPGLGRIPSLPADQLSGFVRGKITINKDRLMDLGFLVGVEWVGEQPRRSWASDAGRFPAQTFLEATLFYSFLYFNFYVTAKNILDWEADTAAQLDQRTFFGYPSPPLNFRAGVSMELGGVYDEEDE